ncbi:MAG: hypothetical protein ACYTGQ_11920 [Planctomycetota bacterium]|jgi:Holliday junction resolvasome RuvABC endonuclease subunit
MKNGTIAVVALMLVLGGAVGIAKAAHHEEKLDLETIMEKFHKGRTSVASRAGKGEATKEEIKKLVASYTAMTKLKPPQGSAESWKKKTMALVQSSKMLAEGAKGGVDAYKKAVNCKACHNVHRPE